MQPASDKIMLSLQGISDTTRFISSAHPEPIHAGNESRLRHRESICDLRALDDKQQQLGIYGMKELRSRFPALFGKHSETVPSTLSLLNARHLRDRPYQSSSRPSETGAAEPADEWQRPGSSSTALSGRSTPSGIYYDQRGVHNYLPMPGTPYAAEKYDFTDPAFVARQRNIRVDYVSGMKSVKSTIASMRERGLDSESIARQVVKMRNDLKEISRRFMEEEEIKLLEGRNREKYGDALGPNADQQYARYNSWETVIEKATEADRKINRLLGISSGRNRSGPAQRDDPIASASIGQHDDAGRQEGIPPRPILTRRRSYVDLRGSRPLAAISDLGARAPALVPAA